MTLSNYALEMMGFHDLIEKGDVTASFMSVTVFEARGITLPDRFAEARESHVAGVNYRVALSHGVNAGAQCLIDLDFAEAEAAWLDEVKATGPFVLVAIGPTEVIDCQAGRMMRMPDGSITTYDGFPGVREILAPLEDRVLPFVVSTLTLALNEPDQYVALRKLARATVGQTPDGMTVHDLRVDARVEVTTPRSLAAARAVEVLDASIKRTPELNQRAAKYFALGTAEDDQLKKFLYFFLSLEVEIHAVFGRIDHAQSVKNRVHSDGIASLNPSAIDLITRGVAKWDNLFDRFVWCATCAWPWLADGDIKLFRELKNARDAIAHGRASEPPPGFARMTELLAHKILWSQGQTTLDPRL